ncbi:MAG TPA: EF-hand domain-containing protein [Pseudoxanthomonas sp.]|nr:EF-hand domain-containing protein [Pseudoxanthomonas sp.]
MSKQKPVVVALGTALAGLTLSGATFAMQPLAQGYMLAAAEPAQDTAKAGEGKCGEGKCGAGMVAPAASAKGIQEAGVKRADDAAAGKAALNGKVYDDVQAPLNGPTAAGKAGREGSCGMARMDTDKDGRISHAEFAAAHGTKVPTLSGDSKDAAFAAIDTDGDGVISQAEMDAHHAAMHKPADGKTTSEGKCGEGKCGEGKCGGMV